MSSTVFSQVVWTDPPFPTQDDQVTLYYDLAEGNAALVNEEPPCPPCPFVYAHTGVITSESTSPSDWQYVQNPWPNGNNGSQANNGNALLPVEGTVHSFDFEDLRLQNTMVFQMASPLSNLHLCFGTRMEAWSAKPQTKATSSMTSQTVHSKSSSPARPRRQAWRPWVQLSPSSPKQPRNLTFP